MRMSPNSNRITMSATVNKLSQEKRVFVFVLLSYLISKNILLSRTLLEVQTIGYFEPTRIFVIW